MLPSLVHIAVMAIAVSIASCSHHQKNSNADRSNGKSSVEDDDRQFAAASLDTLYRNADRRLGMSREQVDNFLLPFNLVRDLIAYSIFNEGLYRVDQVERLVRDNIKGTKNQQRIIRLLKTMVDERRSIIEWKGKKKTTKKVSKRSDKRDKEMRMAMKGMNKSNDSSEASNDDYSNSNSGSSSISSFLEESDISDKSKVSASASAKTDASLISNERFLLSSDASLSRRR